MDIRQTLFMHVYNSYFIIYYTQKPLITDKNPQLLCSNSSGIYSANYFDSEIILGFEAEMSEGFIRSLQFNDLQIYKLWAEGGRAPHGPGFLSWPVCLDGLWGKNEKTPKKFFMNSFGWHRASSLFSWTLSAFLWLDSRTPGVGLMRRQEEWKTSDLSRFRLEEIKLERVNIWGRIKVDLTTNILF